MTAFDQSFFQVRLDWGADGLARLAPSDVVVVVDVLRWSTEALDAVERGEPFRLADGASADGAAVAAAASGAVVLVGGLRNAAAVAREVLAEQHRRGGWVSIAVVPAGERVDDAGGAVPHDAGGAVPTTRAAIEDELGAGAVVDALAAVGLDHSSPEAAVACEAFRGLRGAVRHLLLASGSGQELAARGLADDVRHAAELDASQTVPVLVDGRFRPAR